MEVEKLNASNCREKDDDILLPGFRFHPTDEELVGFYLKRKVEKKPVRIDHLIKHVDIYKFEPWDLPKQVSNSGEREWYFFCRRGRKYKNSIRPNRVTGFGFWKATGIDKPIFSVGEDCIGLKKSLVYYRGSAGKGTKTEWMMHEFRLPASKSSGAANAKSSNLQEAEVWTLCRIFKRELSYKKYESDWRKLASKQSYGDSSSKTSFVYSDDRYQHESLSEVSAEKVIERKPVNDRLHECNNQLMASQRSLINGTTTHQIPFMASYLSFSNQNGDGTFRDDCWDELTPIIEYPVDSSMLYCFR